MHTILMAVRKSKIYINDLQGVLVYNFSRMMYSIEQYKHFMRETGLFEMLQNHIVSNLVDYASVKRALIHTAERTGAEIPWRIWWRST